MSPDTPCSPSHRVSSVLSSSLRRAHGCAVRSAASLESDLRQAIAASGAEVAVAMRTLDGRDEVLIDPDRLFHAASTMKVPVMIELFRQAKAGTLDARRTAPDQERVPQHRRRQRLQAQRRRRFGQGDLRRDRQDDDAAAAVRGDDHGQQQLRREPADREARRRQHPADRRRAWAPAACGAARRRGSESVRQRAEQHDDRARPARAVREDCPRQGGGPRVGRGRWSRS